MPEQLDMFDKEPIYNPYMAEDILADRKQGMSMRTLAVKYDCYFGWIRWVIQDPDHFRL